MLVEIETKRVWQKKGLKVAIGLHLGNGLRRRSCGQEPLDQDSQVVAAEDLLFQLFGLRKGHKGR